jgi:hypothetical protein
MSMAVAANYPALQWPMDCNVGATCNIQNLFDHDRGQHFRDYECGNLGYDGHDGTDIRLPNLASMARGVAVLAAAPGQVRAIRDEMADVNVREVGVESVRGREAGNAVVVQHGLDWETQYSHLRKGSVRVRPGEHVQAGQMLGMVGLSGRTEFPHLHFEVRYKGKPVDPFVGLSRTRACGVGVEPLWTQEALDALQYRPTGLLQAAFADRAPSTESVEAGEGLSEALASDARALVFWVEVFGVMAGDRQRMFLLGPKGETVAEKSSRIAGDKAQWFSYVGRKRRGSSWPSGIYRGVYRLTRDGVNGDDVMVEVERTIEVR